MQKVVKTEITDRYIPFDATDLQVGSTVSFDCYIKRFNGYVIIIEQGTLITEALFQKVEHNDSLYVHESEQDKHHTYCETMAKMKAQIRAMDEAVESVIHLKTEVEKIGESEEKLHHIYQKISHLGYLFFNGDVGKELPLKSLEAFIDVTCHLIMNTKGLLPKFLKMMPNKYHIEYHSVNVSILSMFLGHKIGFAYSDLQKLAMAAILHDIGKLQIDKGILDKESSLSHEEFEAVQEHSSLSTEMASKNGIKDKYILEAILYHHEKLDGTGYPKGLTKNEIPKMAQIIGLCDAFDALTTDRTFRKKYSSFDALTLMKEEMAHQLNQGYINSFIQLLKKQA